MTTAIRKNRQKKEMTLLQAIERVVELAKDSQMSEEFMQEAAPEISFLASSYNITERQVVLFCICMEKGPRRVDYDDLATYLDVRMPLTRWRTLSRTSSYRRWSRSTAS